MLHMCSAPADLALCILKNFVRQTSGKTDHQVRFSELVFKTSGRFDKNLCLAAVLLAKILVLPLHTFVSAEYHHFHVMSPYGIWLYITN